MNLELELGQGRISRRKSQITQVMKESEWREQDHGLNMNMCVLLKFMK